MRKWLLLLLIIVLVVGAFGFLQIAHQRKADEQSQRIGLLETELQSKTRELQRVERAAGWKPGQSDSRSEAYRKEIVERFHRVYYDGQSWEQNQWLGVKTQQNPNDVWITQEIIYEMKPDFIVETGTLEGGSALLWATILEQVNPNGRVITIDIEDQVSEARNHPLAKKVDFLVGSSTAPEIIAEVKRRVGNGKVLVILDSDHRRDHVLRELELYSPLVGVNGYIIVQDSNVNGRPVQPEYGPGPGEAIEEFLKRNNQFVQDRSRERLLMTMHPGGFLRRR
jgi:cephalosporin hydroxylase